MRILVTGGAGFMGSDLVRSLAKENCAVCVVDKLTYAGDVERLKEVEDKVSFYQVDIADHEAIYEIFSKEKPNIVIHYAAETHVDRSILNPDVFIRTNIIGTLSILKASMKLNIKKFIHISTDEVYGELPLDSTERFTENTPLRPNSPYSASKAGADMLIRSFIETYSFPAVIVRASNNYGPWQYPEKLIPLSIAKLLSGEKIPVYGTGMHVRTWLFVEDFTRAVIFLIEKGTEGEIYNVGSGEEKRNIDVIKSILEALGKDEGYIEFVPDRPGHDLRYAIDTTKIEKEVGWKAEVSFEEGIERTIKWYIDNKSWLFKKEKEVKDFIRKLKELYRNVI